MLFNSFYIYRLKYLIKITTIGINGLIAFLIGQSLPSTLSKIFNVVPRLNQNDNTLKVHKTPIISFGELKPPN